jgi:cyanate permease
LAESRSLNASLPFEASAVPAAAVIGIASVTPAWAWVLVALAVLAIAAIILIVVLKRRKATPKPAEDDSTLTFFRQTRYEEGKELDHLFSNPLADENFDPEDDIEIPEFEDEIEAGLLSD